jgi:hypothetical protein
LAKRRSLFPWISSIIYRYSYPMDFSPRRGVESQATSCT